MNKEKLVFLQPKATNRSVYGKISQYLHGNRND